MQQGTAMMQSLDWLPQFIRITESLLLHGDMTSLALAHSCTLHHHTHFPKHSWCFKALPLTTLCGKEVIALLPKEAIRGDPAPTMSLEFLAFAGSTLRTLLFPFPPPAAPTPFHIGEVTNLTCRGNRHTQTTVNT